MAQQNDPTSTTDDIPHTETATRTVGPHLVGSPDAASTETPQNALGSKRVGNTNDMTTTTPTGNHGAQSWDAARMHTLAMPKSVLCIELGPEWPLVHYELPYLIKKKSHTTGSCWVLDMATSIGFMVSMEAG